MIVVIGIVAGIAGGWWYYNKNNAKKVSFRTTEVTRGDILSTISATGTVEPEELVDVGAQVAGLIIAFGKDEDGNEIDYGSPVAEDTMLAKIDDTSYASDVALATAQLEQAKAGVESSKANLLQLKAKLDQARLDWERAQKLGPSEALAKSSYDSYKAAFEVAQANVAVGEAAILQAKASVSQARGDASKSQTKSRILHNKIACGRRHYRPQGQHRANGGVELEYAEFVFDCQGPQKDAGMGLRQRGRHRKNLRGAAGNIYHFDIRRPDV